MLVFLTEIGGICGNFLHVRNINVKKNFLSHGQIIIILVGTFPKNLSDIDNYPYLDLRLVSFALIAYTLKTLLALALRHDSLYYNLMKSSRY